ncbi:unnamed protein product [Thlaspi arvense]|uniref:Uncharacterized protein n=1 Tax=Thlaspi arvense TaxID=13288 RepID=A0AAU9RFY2_THLAR|nr:unnamed protein product [Thlaspi arvense]
MSSSPPLKKQKTSESEQMANEESQKQQESDDIQQQIPSHAGLEITDEEPQKQQGSNGLDDFLCDDEEDLQKDLEGLDIIQVLIRNQLPAPSVTSVDRDVRATIIDTMMSSVDGVAYPLAIHLAVHVFDHYFASASHALNPHTVASSALSLAVKHLYGVDVGAQMKDVEFQILNPIHYRLNAPTTNKLLDAVLSKGPHDTTVMDRDCSQFQISVLGAACLFLGPIYLNPCAPVRATWECDAQRLRDAVTILHELYVGKRLPQCRYHELVALLRCPAVIPDRYF